VPWFHEDALLRVGVLVDDRADDGTRPAGGEEQVRGGARSPPGAPLLRAQSEAHPRLDARHAKSGKQVRALIPLQPSTVVDYESCEIGELGDATP
jgi:hypothetical protein